MFEDKSEVFVTKQFISFNELVTNAKKSPDGFIIVEITDTEGNDPAGCSSQCRGVY